MSKDKYLYIRDNVTGFSFANLGLFVGCGDGIYNAVYSLVILGIFTGIVGEGIASAVVGVYVGIYSVFCMLVGLFSNQLLRWFNKARLLYASMILIGACYTIMSMSVNLTTFVTMDYLSGFAYTLIMLLIPLFMADFSKHVGMANLNARYHFWNNVGALMAPLIATSVASYFSSNRLAFFASALVYLTGLIFFKRFGIVQEEKQIAKVSPKRTFNSLMRAAKSFLVYPNMARAYGVNFGYYALRALRLVYVPIIVIEYGFSATTLGIVLTLGIIPYIVIDLFIGKWVKKYGSRLFMTIGLVSLAVLAFMATRLTGYSLLAVFVAWQISGAFMEPVHDLLFFDNTKKSEQSRFYGIFRTSVNLPSVITPILGAVCIATFGSTSAVWYVSGTIAMLATAVLWAPHK